MRFRTMMLTALFAVTLIAATNIPEMVHAAPPGQPADWQQYYYYPYVTYPHTYQQNTRGFNHMYYRYPQSMQIPVYNKDWYNFYPTEKPYHKGHHFILDVF